jgi:hypothetical protein
MIFEVNQDGRRKARLVAGGHMVDPMGINSRSTVVKGISVRLLDLIAHGDNLPILCGDIGNAFITANALKRFIRERDLSLKTVRDPFMISKTRSTALDCRVAPFGHTSRIC